jgi:pteridine reductase
MTGSSGKVALVTGGARRIGAAVARALAEEGFTVLVTYRASRGEARALAREIGGRACPLDLRNAASIPGLAARVERDAGRLDLLVHNAAVFPRTPAGEVTAAAWDEVFAVNLRGPFLLTQAFLPLLRRSPGSGVLFMGDAGAGKLWPAYLPYCISKLAGERQAAAWKKVLSPAVRVGVVRPGLALIPPGFSEEAWERLRSREAARGPDTPGKVAAAVLRFARRGRYNSRCFP